MLPAAVALTSPTSTAPATARLNLHTTGDPAAHFTTYTVSPKATLTTVVTSGNAAAEQGSTAQSGAGWSPNAQWPPQLNHEGGWHGDGGLPGAAATAVPVFNSNGSQVAIAATNPATGAVELGAPSPGTVTMTCGTTATATTTPSVQTTAANSAPVFNAMGTQIGAAVQDPATGTVQLIGPTGNVLGTVRQQDGTVDLIGAGGAVLGSFALRSARQMILMAPGTAGSTATRATTVSATATIGDPSGAMPHTRAIGPTTGSTAGTAVPVFDAGGIQIGLATTNPATGAAELIGFSGNILGVIAVQNNAVNLVGAGNAVLGSFAVNQASGQVLFIPAAAGAAARTTPASGTFSTTGAV